MTFDNMIARIKPIATEVVDADESAFGMEEHCIKGLLCLIMALAEQVPKDKRAEVAGRIGTCMLPLQELKRYSYQPIRES